MNTKNMKVESKSMQKKEDKQILNMRNGIIEVKRELRQHEKMPMDKAHPQK
jgi:hypothetical protein